MQKNIYYVGFRESDLQGSDYFAGSITKFGTNSNNNISFMKYRLNPFAVSNEVELFFKQNLNKIAQADTKARFIFYNQRDAYRFDEKIFSKTIGANSLGLINLFNDKFFVRQFIKDIALCPQNYVLSKNLINLNELITIFETYKQVVLQETEGSGGSTTYIYDKYQLPKLQNLKSDFYLVSGFIEKSIPVSVHVLVTDSRVYVFQPSIQIIKGGSKYYGGDFVSAQSLPLNIKQEIKKTSENIGKSLKSLGYLGVFGINYLATTDKLYFIEINLRFMGSTLLLNRYLLENGFKTLQEYHIDAFLHREIDLTNYDFESKINLSNLIIFKGEQLSDKSFKEIVYDGFNKNMCVAEKGYCFTAVYDHKI